MIRLFVLCICSSSFLILSACSFFSTDSEMMDEEDYYEDDVSFEVVSEDESEESEELIDEEEDEQEISDVSVSEETGLEEDIYYIDEEDTDFIEEGAIVEEEPYSEEQMVNTSEDDFEEEVDEVSFQPDQPEKDSFKGSDSGSQEKDFVPPALDTPKVNIPYRKIKTEAYNANGFLVNAVYIARQGETLTDISRKIFGAENLTALQVINPHLKARSVKVGDKIYYSSPNRPQDSNRLLFYFEDIGANPEYFNVPAGSNIRKIASQLLGHAQSWKEIYATNPDLQTKWQVESDATVKYWPSGSGGSISPLPADEPPSSVVEEKQEPVIEQEEPSEGEQLDPSEVSEQKDQTPPPFPPGEEPDSEKPKTAEPQQPADPIAQKQKNPFVQKNMILGIVLVVIALICILFILKKRRNKRNFDYTDTAANFEIDEK